MVATLYVFTDKYAGATFIATGSTEARTRLYRMGIANNLLAIEKDFIIFGLTDKKSWESFSKNKQYGAFLVRRKL